MREEHNRNIRLIAKILFKQQNYQLKLVQKPTLLPTIAIKKCFYHLVKAFFLSIHTLQSTSAKSPQGLIR